MVFQPIPARNLYSLTDQLKLRPPRSISRVVRHKSPNYPIGHQDKFYILSTDTNRYFVSKATILAKTPHLYLYVQDGVHVTRAAAQVAANRFERSIYPTDHSFFGSEWTPGVDGDPHITCFVGNLQSSGVGGYYSAEDEYPRVVNRYSNQREMIYISSDSTVPGDPLFDETMAHEFQHMIHWHMHSQDNAWLNEGNSMLAEYLNRFTPVGEASAFLSAPSTELISWSVDDSSTLPHYGAAYLFLAYLYQRFGRGIISDLLRDYRYTDFALLNDVFRRRHIAESPNQVFADWATANYVANGSFAHGLYGYPQLLHRVTVHPSRAVPFTLRGSLPEYAAKYIEIPSLKGRRAFRLTFSGAGTVPVVGVGNAQPFWWSNRGDMSDTSLVRPVDLRHVHHATLHFRAWWRVEKDYDYAYVEVSADGGKTWQTLRGTGTTATNPNGANYGHAFTGSSGNWKNVQINLSRFTGKRVLLRFQYVTDDEYNDQGFVMKDIAIPEIHFRDNFSGWRQHGFLPISVNAMPNAWRVELISYTTHGTSVRALPISGGNHGSLRIDPRKEGLKQLVAVVFTTAPKTTLRSSYVLTAR